MWQRVEPAWVGSAPISTAGGIQDAESRVVKTHAKLSNTLTGEGPRAQKNPRSEVGQGSDCHRNVTSDTDGS